MDMPKKDIYNDVWAFYKKYLPECTNDDKWEEIIAEGNKIIKKHDDFLCNDLIQVVLGEFGRCQRKSYGQK